MHRWRTPPLGHRLIPHLAGRGFSVIELMVAVCVIAVLATLAVPHFGTLIARWRVHQTIEGMQSSLYYARSEALKRGGNVFISKQPSSSTGCHITEFKNTKASGTGSESGADWDCGWVIFIDLNHNKTLDTNDDEVLQRFATPTNIAVKRSSNQGSIEFNHWGYTHGARGIGFSVYSTPSALNAAKQNVKTLCMSSGGRIRIVARDSCS